MDGVNLPPEGTNVHLRRAGTTIHGIVAWRKNDQLGLRFVSEIDVDEFVRKLEHPGQRRVDAVVAGLRSGRVAAISRLQASSSSDVEQLTLISKELDQVCENLAKRPELTADLAEDVIRLDTLAQRLREWIVDSDRVV